LVCDDEEPGPRCPENDGSDVIKQRVEDGLTVIEPRGLDLANDDGDVVIVSSEGWRLQGVELLPVLFGRTALTGPLPVPVFGGDLDELRRFLNVTPERRPLIVGWLSPLCCRRSPSRCYLSTASRARARRPRRGPS
jgi:hypothetical protein